MTGSSILTGTVRHRRDRPRQHHFTYDMWHVLLDVDELPRLDREVTAFTYNRRGLASFRDTDHLGPVDLPVREKLRRFLAGQGVELPAGRVLLQTSLRVLGHTFNPVSWFWCHDDVGDLQLVVAEVNNTFGDTHCYVLDELEWTGEHRVVAHDRKVLHVSPFMAIEGHDYRFVFRPPSLLGAPGERVAVHMDVSDQDGHLFDATVGQRRAPLTTRSLWRQLLRMPWVTFKTVVAIHWEALFILGRRKARFRRRPEPPDTGFDAITRSTQDAA